MEPTPPDPHASREDLYEAARRLHAAYEEKRAVVERIKAYVGVWKQDKRMRIMGDIALREIDRIEREERDKSASRSRAP